MRVREGEGRTAVKLRGMLTEALAARTGAEVLDMRLWTQPGDYRKARWDLARWGADAELDRRTYRQKVALYSWSTMTECARHGISITDDGEVSPFHHQGSGQ